MNLVFIYRSKNNNAFSIENVFDTVANHIDKNDIIISKYYKEKSLIKTIIELRKMPVDHYHITGDVYYLALFLPRNKTTMTIHDIGSYKNHKKTLKTLLIGLFWFYLPMKYLVRFSVISKLVESDIKNFFSISSKKITIINNPLTINISKLSSREDNDIINILQIGSGKHKNLIGLIEAVKGLDKIKLNIIGNPEAELVDLMKKYKIDFTVFKNISGKQVIELYSLSNILYFASFSEGFGLPILEAQASGVPVITSKMQPMTYVGCDSVHYVTPSNIEEIRSAIILLINNIEYKQQLIKKGYQNIQRFDPKIIAGQYYSFFKKKIR